MKINCSDEKIDALRDKVKGFATTMPMGKFKVVRLEEFDYLGHDAQALLRALIEDVSSSCRFIATCNYINKVTPPLRSRFQEFAIKAPAREDIVVLAAEILEAEGIEFDVDDLDKVVAASYPDVRKMIQLLEGSSINGKLSLTTGAAAADWKLELLPLLEAGDLKAARKVVCDSATTEELQDVFRFLFDNLHRIKCLKANVEEAVLRINDYQYKHVFVGDKELNVYALFGELALLS
jgi:replication factor C small subunit